MAAKIPPAKPGVRKLFRETLIKEGLTYRRASILRMEFGISIAEALEIYYETFNALKAESDAIKKVDLAKSIALATEYRKRHKVGKLRLSKLFGITAYHANKIIKAEEPVEAKVVTPKQASEKQREAAMAYVKRCGTFATLESIATRFSVSLEWTKAAFEQVMGGPKKQPRRKVRIFCDISHSDLTTDRVRYPSGIGFAVLEVVR
jgi:hypothetical protein